MELTSRDDKDNGRIDVIGIAFCCLALLIVTPVIIASGYSFYQADDFSHAGAVGVFGENVVRLLAASLKFTKVVYLTWRGTYTSMFLQAFLSPLNGFGDIQLCIVMVLNIVLFIVSLFVFIGIVCKKLSIGNRYIWIVISLCTIGIFGFESWTEVFYWFSGAVSYSFPLSFCLLGIAVTLQSEAIKGGVCGAVLMFLASGGSLEVAGTGCWVLLGICVIKKMQKRVKAKDYVVFATAIAGAFINTAAPGNYVRHTMIDDSGLHFGRAVITTVQAVIQGLEELICNSPFVLIILAAVLLGAYIGRNSRPKDIKGVNIYDPD